LHLGTCEPVEIGKKDTVIKAKTLMKYCCQGKIADLTAQIKLQIMS
jgi:hypothetical protein